MECYEKYKASGVEFIDKLIERMDQNQEIFEKILEDHSFGGLVKELMMKKCMPD